MFISKNQEPPAGWPRYPRFNEPGDVPGPPVQFGPPVTNANVKAGYGFIPNGVEEKNLYYYHPDHLGSSSYITDRDGQIIQHTEYMAFGELLVDEHSTSNKQPYLFNGKELDYETGFYYYGARYYDPKTSIFLSVDPLVEKTGTPYVYTYNNPIRYIDPTGMIAIPPEDSGGYKTGEVWTDSDGSWTRTNGGWKNNDKNGESYIDEVKLLSAKAQSNRMEAQRQANIDAARYRFYNAVENCKACQEIKAVENFMFRDIPMAIITGGTYSMAGRIGNVGYKLLGGQTIGQYIQGASIKAGADILTQYAINGSIDYKQTVINSLVVGYKWGLGLGFANNNLNSYSDGKLIEHLPQNFVKLGTAALSGQATQFGPTIQSHGTGATIMGEIMIQGLNNLQDYNINNNF